MSYTASAAGKSQMRTFVLSNGNILWDMAGNVWQMTDAQIQGSPWYNPGATAVEWTNGNVSGWIKSIVGPAGSQTSSGGGGAYIGALTAGNIILRGGSAGDGYNSSIFTYNVNFPPTGNANGNVGFRCAMDL